MFVPRIALAVPVGVGSLAVAVYRTVLLYCPDAWEGYESLHNKNYWLNGEYYGFGLGAVGYINNTRINNTKNFSKYIKGEFEASREFENEKMRKENDLILGFRLIRGIIIEEFNRKYQDNLLEKEVIKELINDGYLEIDDGYIKIKREYIYLQNTILEKIMGSELIGGL